MYLGHWLQKLSNRCLSSRPGSHFRKIGSGPRIALAVEDLEERSLLTGGPSSYYLMLSAPGSIASGGDWSVSVMASPMDPSAPAIAEYRYDLGGEGSVDATSASGTTFSWSTLISLGYQSGSMVYLSVSAFAADNTLVGFGGTMTMVSQGSSGGSGSPGGGGSTNTAPVLTGAMSETLSQSGGNHSVRISGVVSDLTNVGAAYAVEVDLNGDSVADCQYSTSLGSFNYTLDIPVSTSAISVRVIEQQMMLPALSSSWQSLSISAPVVSSGLELDDIQFVRRDVPGSTQIYGQLAANFSAPSSADAVYHLEVDNNLDGLFDQSIQVVTGDFVRAVTLPFGNMRFQVRVAESHNGVQTDHADWVSVNVPMVSVVNTVPVLQDEDWQFVGNGQASSTVAGIVSGAVVDSTTLSGESYTVQVDWTGDGQSDATWTTNIGNFSHNLEFSNTTEEIRLRVLDGNSAESPWVVLSVASSTPPESAGLEMTETEVSLGVINTSGRIATISGVITDDTVAAGDDFMLDVDLNGDGVAESSHQISLGAFDVIVSTAASASSVHIRATQLDESSEVIELTNWITLNWTNESPPTNSAPVFQDVIFTPVPGAPGAGLSGGLSATLADSSTTSTYAVQVDFTGDGQSDTNFPVGLGSIAQTIIVPAGVTVFRIRAVETASNSSSSETLATPWGEIQCPTNTSGNSGDGGSGSGGSPANSPPPPVVVDWNAIELARQNALQAQVEFEQAITTFDAIGQAMVNTYVQALAQADIEREATLALAQEEYVASLLAAQEAYEAEMLAIDQEREDTEANIEADDLVLRAGAAAQHEVEMADALAEYNQSKLNTETAYNDRKALANQAYLVSMQAATDAYNLATTAISATFDNAVLASEGLRASEVSAAAATYDSSVATATGIRDAALTSNAATRTAEVTALRGTLSSTLSSYSSMTYDTSLVQNDPAVQQAIADGIAQFNFDLATASQAYNDALDAAEDAFDATMVDAGDDWETALAAADTARSTAKSAAAAVYQKAVDDAVDLYEGDVQAAADAKANELADAEAMFDLHEASARATRNGEFDDAEDTFDREMADALAVLESGLASDASKYAGQLATQRGTWEGSVGSAAADFNRDMAKAEADAQRDTLWNIINVYFDPVGDAWDTLSGILSGIAYAFNSGTYLTMMAAHNTNILNMQTLMSMGLATQDDLSQAYKDYSVWISQGIFNSASQRESSELAYVTEERNKTTDLAVAASAVAFAQAGAQLSATETLAHKKIEANSTYEQAIAGIEAAQYKDQLTKTAIYLYKALLSTYTFNQKTIAAQQDYSLEVAKLQETYDKEANKASEKYSLEELRASVVKAKTIVDAEEVQAKAESAADLQYVKAGNAADTAYTQASTAAYVAFIDSAATAELAFVTAYTSAVKSALTPIIMAEAAALCNLLGDTPDAFFFTQQNAMEQLAEVSAWAVQVVGDTTAEGALARSESTAYKAQIDAEAAAQQKKSNSDATDAKTALDAEADAYATAQEAGIDASETQALDDIDNAKTANDDDAEADRKRTEKEIKASAGKQLGEELATYLTSILKITADVITTGLKVDAGLTQLGLDAPTNVKNLKAQVSADIQALRMKSAAGAQAAITGARGDRDLAITHAAQVLKNIIKQAGDNLAYVQSLPLSAFVNGTNSGIAMALMWAQHPELDQWTNFFTGWADGLTAGYWSGLLGQTGYLRYVDYNSLEYSAGKVIGMVHGLVIAVLSGGSCQAGWAKTFGTGLTWSSTAWSMYDASNKIMSGTATVWDYLAYLPAAGYVVGWLNRACFVGETEIATGWGSVNYASAALPLAGDSNNTEAAWLDDWSLECALVGTGILVLTAVYTRKRKEEQRELDLYFAAGNPEELEDDSNVGWALLPVREPQVEGEARCGRDALRLGEFLPFNVNISTKTPSHGVPQPQQVISLVECNTSDADDFNRQLQVESDSTCGRVAPRLGEFLPLNVNLSTKTPSHGVPRPHRASNLVESITGSAGFDRQRQSPPDENPVNPIEIPPSSGLAAPPDIAVQEFPDATASLIPSSTVQRNLTILATDSPHHRPKPIWQMPRWMAAVAVLLALGCFWNAIPSNARPGTSPAVAASSTQSGPSARPKYVPQRQLLTKRIDEIRPGMRVLADNPELAGVEIPQLQVAPETTRLVRLHQIKPDGHALTVDRLMPIEELAEIAVDLVLTAGPPKEPRPWIGNQVDVALWNTLLGQSLDVQLPEMGFEGPATIVAIDPCPTIEPDDGAGRRLVTTVFRHEAANVIDIEIQGQDQPLGTTTNHPFWSSDRHAFVPAESLKIGERLKQANGVTTQVTRITPHRGPPTTVYNLEVDGQHVYYVGENGVLVHNTCTFHGYAIINKVTGQIYKFGVTRRGFKGSALSSVRGHEQLAKIAANNGVHKSVVQCIVLRKFDNTKAMFQWENETVGFFRQLGHALPDNIRPNGLPFWSPP